MADDTEDFAAHDSHVDAAQHVVVAKEFMKSGDADHVVRIPNWVWMAVAQWRQTTQYSATPDLHKTFRRSALAEKRGWPMVEE